MANKKNRPCSNCGNLTWDTSKARSTGLCKKCWATGRKHTEATKLKLSKYKTENPGYHAIHQRIYKLWGKPKLCEICGTREIDQSYEWASKEGNYILDRKEWLRVCISCHRRIDYDRPKLNDWHNLSMRGA